MKLRPLDGEIVGTVQWAPVGGRPGGAQGLTPGVAGRFRSDDTAVRPLLLAAILPPLFLVVGAPLKVGAWASLITCSLFLQMVGARLLLQGAPSRRPAELALRVSVVAPIVTLGLAGALWLFAVGWFDWSRVALAGATTVLLYLGLAVAPATAPSRRADATADAGLSADLLDTGLSPACRFCKRAIDVVVTLPVFVLAAPVILLAAIAVCLESPGGWLFTQTRLGANGRPFRFFKLRTMYVDNDESEHHAYVAALVQGTGEANDGLYKLARDPRRTRIGAVLRRLSIDELPQLWNVLKGDMSLVGPRPPTTCDAALYDERAWRRLAVKPGITGLWQVNGRSRLTFSQMVDLDLQYCRRWSPLLDLKILALTPKAAFWDRETA